MLKRAIQIVQQHLKNAGQLTGSPDGKMGPITNAAVKQALTARQAQLPAGWQGLNAERHITMLLQLMCKDKGIDADPVDGYWGPVTQNAYEGLVRLLNTGNMPENWRDDEPSDANPHTWPRDRGNQQEMRNFYGQPGSPPMKSVAVPWKMRLAWDKSEIIRTISVHTKVASSVANVFQRVHQHYGDAELKRLRLDLFGGCFAPRKKRGGSTWSTHAWAVALDFDPERNQLKWGRDRAAMAHKDYKFWFDAWEADGWVSLGRSRNFDWMHVQAARL
jgi:hypothetical protein